jgi:hypothetical protein
MRIRPTGSTRPRRIADLVLLIEGRQPALSEFLEAALALLDDVASLPPAGGGDVRLQADDLRVDVAKPRDSRVVNTCANLPR